MKRSTGSIALAVCVGAILVAIATAGIAAPAEPVECRPPNGLKADAERTETTSSGQNSETTQYFGGGVYEVTQCDSGGIKLSQVVSPIPVPGGKTALVPRVTTLRMGSGLLKTTPVLYGNPDDPAWSALCEKHGAQAQEMVVPPTKKSAE